ncbi:FeoB-associated Cys-rich membrane protein [Malikia sp.]|uniref:FeoB-associated Cys-rich membrane protein n=1 Tax=Malikia sp. TaxID=2070706 RepID=UPI002625608B|nr:FeoB-associated Cys-rich membrane protein [Malikia sp.]MDD2730409.1 FeoB-associated Cys-rich membrane protein [Malikia sp.]
MNETLDLIVVLALVALAFGFLLRRQLRRRQAATAGESCSGCARCGSAPACGSRQDRVG